MMTREKTACQWCDTLNDPTLEVCIACGGPLEVEAAPYPPPKLYTVQPAAAPLAPVPAAPAADTDIDELTKSAEKLVEGAAGAYSLFWRTLGEALGIAVSCVVTGFFGGAIGAGWWALLACAAIGIAVGMANKPFWLSALSAPVGALIGAVIGLALWLVGMRIPVLALLPAAGLALLAAFLGSSRGSTFQGWERLRPFLGLLGGLAFGTGGVLLGWLLKRGVEYLLSGALAFLV